MRMGTSAIQRAFRCKWGKIELIVERTESKPPPPRYTADTLVPLRTEAIIMVAG